MSEQPTSELAARIGATGALRSRRDLARDIDAIRRLAAASGHYPVMAVAQVLESALARGECGPLIRQWLVVMNDALHCQRHDADAGTAFAAACSVRLAG